MRYSTEWIYSSLAAIYASDAICAELHYVYVTMNARLIKDNGALPVTRHTVIYTNPLHHALSSWYFLRIASSWSLNDWP